MGKDVPYFDLPGGGKIPCFGLGTYQTDENAIESALEAGYRLFDTATMYGTEKIIGNVINRWMNDGKIRREELFLITKLPPQGMKPQGVHKYIQQSLEDLQVDYIDLYLTHMPVGLEDVSNFFEAAQKNQLKLDQNTDIIAIWKAMEEEVQAGHLRSIGLSNFNMRQVQRIIDNATVPVANLQVELHAYHQQEDLVKFCKENNITVTSYFTLGSAYYQELLAKMGVNVELPSILDNPVVKAIAVKLDKTPGQILLRHCHEKGVILIPKSSNPERQKQNLDIFDFKLDAEDVEKLDGLDQGDVGQRLKLNMIPGHDEHPEYPFSKK